MERYTVFLEWKNQYCQNDYTTQGNLQIQCNPYQITRGIFQRLTSLSFFNSFSLFNLDDFNYCVFQITSLLVCIIQSTLLIVVFFFNFSYCVLQFCLFFFNIISNSLLKFSESSSILPLRSVIIFMSITLHSLLSRLSLNRGV